MERTMSDTPITTPENQKHSQRGRTKKFLIAGAVIGALGAAASAFAADELQSKNADCKYSSSPAELREKADRKVNRFARFVLTLPTDTAEKGTTVSRS